MDELLREMKDDIDACTRSARRNYAWAYFFLVVALTATVASTVISALDAIPGPVRAAVAAIPGIVVLINSTLNFEQKSRYCWLRVRSVEGLLRQLRDGGQQVADVSAKFTELRTQLEAQWPAFGSLPTKPKQPEG
jgi:hypothetical protein